MAISFSEDEIRLYYSVRIPVLKQFGAELRAPCPVHHGVQNSFAVCPLTGHAFCHSQCSKGWDIIGLERELMGASFAEAKNAVFEIVGRPASAEHRRKIETYSYRDESDRILFEVVRFDPKDFRQRKPDGKGGWEWNVQGVRLVLYRLPKLLRKTDQTIFICEGEKDVHSLESFGLLATCNPMGAGKWRDEYGETLRGRDVVILPDNDPPTDENNRPHYRGQKHAGQIATNLLRHGCNVRIVELPGAKDASDWFAMGHTLEQFLAFVTACPATNEQSLTEWESRWIPEVGSSDDDLIDGWPVPATVQAELPPVQKFTADLLPVSFRPLAVDIAERMQVPLDYPAMLLVLCLAGVVNRRAIIQPKANDGSWLVVPNLWGGLIAPPGFMKSPVIHAATRPLQQIQADWRRDYEAALSEHRLAMETWVLEKSAWKELSKADLKKGGTARVRPPDPPSAPVLKRLIVNDATFEAMHETMNENPAGILVIRDEFTGWWSQLDRAGREGERAFCLQAWNGDTSHTIDRIGRGTVHVEACCMSMLGGIQPGRLRSYLAEALEDGPGNDGLIQRFQLLVWPDTEPTWQYVDREPNTVAQDEVTHIFRRLISLEPSLPLRFRFSPTAQELFIARSSELEGKVRGDQLHPALISHLSKYRKLMPALALLFELADLASITVSGGGHLSNSSELTVSVAHAAQAADICSYLESHANRIYSCVITPQMRATQQLAEKIKKRSVQPTFSCRDIYVKAWSGLDSPEIVSIAIQRLLDADWIRELESEKHPAGGRPAKRYQVNPRVWQ